MAGDVRLGERQLLLLNGRSGWWQAYESALPARLVSTATLSDSQDVLILHEDSKVTVVRSLT